MLTSSLFTDFRVCLSIQTDLVPVVTPEVPSQKKVTPEVLSAIAICTHKCLEAGMLIDFWETSVHEEAS